MDAACSGALTNTPPLSPRDFSAQLVLRTQDVKESVRKAAFRTLGEDVRERGSRCRRQELRIAGHSVVTGVPL